MKLRDSQPSHGKAICTILGIDSYRRGRDARVLASWVPVEGQPWWVLVSIKSSGICSGVPMSDALQEKYFNRPAAESSKVKRA